MNIEEVGLSVRAFNCLKKAGINTIEDMALADIKKLKNCGKKTILEIKDKIIKLKEKGFYSEDFLSKFEEKKDYVDTLELSVRSKNILKSLSISNENDLLNLDEETLSNARNSGKTSVNEIINYIERNKTQLREKLFKSGNYKINFPINTLSSLYGETRIDSFCMSSTLKESLKNNNIEKIFDLLFQKYDVEENILYEYEAIYKYFYDIVYNSNSLIISDAVKNMFVILPFNLGIYVTGDYVLVNELFEYGVSNFESFSKSEKINFKLYLYWINSFKINDFKTHILNQLDLSDKQIEILAQRPYKTLEELGIKYDVTRERIRQIEANGLRKAREKYLKFPFRFLSYKKVYYIEKSNEFELLLLCIDSGSEHKYLFVRKDLEEYYLPKYYVEVINQKIEDNKDIFEYNGYLKFDDISVEMDLLNKIIDYLELNFNNGFISRRLTKKNQVKYAMRYLGRPVNLSNEKDLDEIINTVKYLFGTELEKGRGLESLINEAGVRVDSGTYSSDDEIIPIPINILNEIKNYIKAKKIINARDLFINFGQILREHNLDNEVILYRYLKEQFDSELYFHGVSAVISSDPNLGSWGDVITKEIIETGKPVNKLDFMVKYSITEAVYINLPINFKDIIVWSSKELYLKSMIKVSLDLINKLTNEIKEKQIVKFEEIKYIIKNFDKDLLIKNNVNNNDNFYNLLINIFPDEFIVDRNLEEVRYKGKRKLVIQEEYLETEELTI